MKNSIIIAILVLILSSQSNLLAQGEGRTIEYYDVLHLRNGDVLRGSILKETEKNEYNFVTVEGKTLVIPFERVEKIEREKAERITNPVVERLFPKYYAVIEPGFMAGFEDIELENGSFDNSGVFPGISAMMNMLVTPQTSMGLGLGYQKYGEGSMMPLTLDFRGYFGRMWVLPFAAVNLGYSWGWSDENNNENWGGVFINPNAGVAFKWPRAGTIFVRAGYKLQRIEVENVSEKVNAQFLTVKVGYSFY